MIKRIYERLKEIGIDDSVAVDEAKKVRLVNMICLIWGSFVLIFICMDAFVYREEVVLIDSILTHGLGITGITASLLANHHRKFEVARLILVLNTLSQTVLFAYVVQPPGHMIELNMCLIPPISMLFLKDRRWHVFLLVLCLVLYVVPNIYLDPNGPALDLPVTKMTLFVGFYLVVDYFIRLNKKNESNLARQKAEIEELYKFKNRFFVNVAHEIRTPLTILSGNLRRLPETDSLSREGATMDRQISKIKNIVDDVLDLSKMDTGHFRLKRELIPIKAFIEKTFSSFQSNFQNKKVDYQLINYLDEDLGIMADRVYLERALNNIIHNAFKYISSETGIVHIILDYVDGGGVQIKVKDNGIGIPVEDQERIFDQFYQVSNDINDTGGSGIGLAFSKEVITKLDGQMILQSEPGKGSEFIIRFGAGSLSTIKIDAPIKEVEEPVAKEKDVIIEKGDSSKTLLVVEDHPEMREYITSVLKDYRILEAVNGQEALEVLKKKHVDLILTDYMMPVMDGMNLVKSLKEQGCKHPVIVLTARADQGGKMDMLEMGVDDYLTKPFEEEELRVRIRNRLQNAEERKEITEEEVEENLTGDSKLLTEIVDYIRSHCGDKQLSVDLICNQFNLSTSSLYRKVKGASGLSPKNLITEVRLLHVRDLMNENPDISRKELALSVGLGNTTYLSKMYQERFGKRI